MFPTSVDYVRSCSVSEPPADRGGSNDDDDDDDDGDDDDEDDDDDDNDDDEDDVAGTSNSDNTNVQDNGYRSLLKTSVEFLHLSTLALPLSVSLLCKSLLSVRCNIRVNQC